MKSTIGQYSENVRNTDRDKIMAVIDADNKHGEKKHIPHEEPFENDGAYCEDEHDD